MNDQKNRTPGTIGGEKILKTAIAAALLTLAACGGGGGDGDEPDYSAALESEIVEANADVAGAVAGEALVVTVLNNDTFEEGATIELLGQPDNGTATISADGVVVYTANAEFEGTDTVEYILVDSEGAVSRGTLFLAVVCAECSITPLAYANPEGLPYCLSSESDTTGDGYGWENDASCAVPAIGAALDPLAAKADSIDINAGEIKTVSPLRNDSIADRANVEFSLDVQPIAGTVLASGGGIIVYQAPQLFSGSDSLTYTIEDTNGATSFASIDFNVICSECVDYQALRLSWPENPADEGVEGYQVLFGADDNPLTSTVVSDVQVASLNGEAPNVVFDLESDLNITGSEGGCFMIKAYRGSEESETSEAACFTRS